MSELKIYLLSQAENTGYDTYDSCIVAAESEEDAKTIHPSGFATHYKDGQWYGTYSGGEKIGQEYELSSYPWCHSPDIVTAVLVGIASPGVRRGVILASFNAG